MICGQGSNGYRATHWQPASITAAAFLFSKKAWQGFGKSVKPTVSTTLLAAERVVLLVRADPNSGKGSVFQKINVKNLGATRDNLRQTDMKMKTFITFLTAGLILCSFGTPSFANQGVDKNLTQQVSDILKECEKIKPGMTRAELLKVFTTEGGLSTATHRTFGYRSCPIIKVDVDFALSDPNQNALEERPTDTISKISKPYLEGVIID